MSKERRALPVGCEDGSEVLELWSAVIHLLPGGFHMLSLSLILVITVQSRLKPLKHSIQQTQERQEGNKGLCMDQVSGPLQHEGLS